MTDGPVFQVSNDALREYDEHGALMAQVHESLMDSLVQRDNDEMMRLLKGTWPEPEQEDVGLFQQSPASFKDNEPLSREAVQKQLQEKFADKLGTRTPESAEIMARAFPVGDAERGMVIVPRKSKKKPTGIDPTGPTAQAIVATQRTMVASSHTHGMGAMQSTTQVAALNIGGRDVEECSKCGALVLDTNAHRKFHTDAEANDNGLRKIIGEQREEIAELRKKAIKRVPRPTAKKLVDIQGGMVVGDYVLENQLIFPGNAAKSEFLMRHKYDGSIVKLSAQEFVTHCEQNGKTVDLKNLQPSSALREQGATLHTHSFVNMSVEGDPKLTRSWNERMGVID